ncbi:MAG: FAD-binding oxidoreductase [Saprospiraceae bacterium]|nr:FAD-binding oxidoreductase [Saprospiraceae bacterium]
MAALGAITLTGTLSSTVLQSCHSAATIPSKVSGVLKADAAYEDLRTSMVQIANSAKRYPDIIVSPTTEVELLECLQFAKENDLQIVCRSSGHNNAGAVLRNGGMLINMGAFNKFDVDPSKKTMTVQASTRFEQIVPVLKEHDLGFPLGDCGNVAFGGYILGGGLGTNGNHYTQGPACYALISAEVLLESGEKVVVDKERNSDIFWAIRGCGPAFFGIILNYTIQLFEPLGAMVTKSLTFPLEELEAKVRFFDRRMETKDDRVETRIRLKDSPNKGGLVIEVVISAITLKGPTALRDAEKLVQYYMDEGLGQAALSENETKTADVDFEFFHYPPGFRTFTDNIYTDDPKALSAIVAHFENKPDCNISMSLNHFAQVHPFREDACYTPKGKHFINYHVHWMDETLDEAAAHWMKKTEALLKPYRSGHYLNQTECDKFPDHVQACFSKENWMKLARIRKKYDPDNRFFTYLNHV